MSSDITYFTKAQKHNTKIYEKTKKTKKNIKTEKIKRHNSTIKGTNLIWIPRVQEDLNLTSSDPLGIYIYIYIYAGCLRTFEDGPLSMLARSLALDSHVRGAPVPRLARSSSAVAGD